MGGEAAQQPGQWRAEDRQPADAVADPAELAELEVHRALEQDDGHAQTDQLGEFLLRQCQFDHAGDRPEQEAGGDQDHDRWQADAPRDPLAGETRGEDDQEQRCGVHHG